MRFALTTATADGVFDDWACPTIEIDNIEPTTAPPNATNSSFMKALQKIDGQRRLVYRRATAWPVYIDPYDNTESRSVRRMPLCFIRVRTRCCGTDADVAADRVYQRSENSRRSRRCQGCRQGTRNTASRPESRACGQ